MTTGKTDAIIMKHGRNKTDKTYQQSMKKVPENKSQRIYKEDKHMGSERIMTTAKNNMCCCRMMCDCMAFISYALNT